MSVIDHADGVHDLVIVADRSQVSRARLESLALAIKSGEDHNLTSEQEASGEPAVEGMTDPEWGCGDPTATDSGTTRFEAGDVDAARLLTAARLAFAQYRGELVESTDPVVDHRGNLTSFVAPALVVVIDGPNVIGEYRPFLAPPAALVVHFRHSPTGGFTGHCEFAKSLVDPAIARGFCQLLTGILSAPDPADVRPDVSELFRIGGFSEEIAWPDRENPTIVAAFSEMVNRQPDATAITDTHGNMTYRQLDELADTIAAGLRDAGARQGDRLGICLGPDRMVVASMLAVLKLGCVYVPLDPRYPQDRLLHIVADAGLSITIGDPDTVPIEVVSPKVLLGSDDAPGAALGTGDDPAYVIYTSGSTGRPKGVVVPHRNVLALLDATRDDLDLSAEDVWTLFHSTAFDFSVWEIWGALLTGGRLLIVDSWTARSTDDFHALLAQQRVTVLNQTPSAFAQLIEVDRRSARPLSLRLVVFGGEALPVPMLRNWFAKHPDAHCRLVNMFGITETTVHATSHTVEPIDVLTDSRSVGRPLPGWWVSVRDPEGRLVPLGCSGEIHVGGRGVASHYLGRDDLTAERFIVDPYTGERIYRSGDLGRLRPDGQLDHLGRLDSQVKVRGYRIELGEIRSVLSEAPSVVDAAVIVHRTDPADPVTARIEAYVVLRSGSVEDVSRQAALKLPEYMIPTTVVEVAELPLTANGKLDVPGLRKNPAPKEVPTPTTHGGEAAEVLRAWRTVLDADCGIDDNFFELGGNSLLVIRTLTALREQGSPEISARDFYRNPTARQLAAVLASRAGGTA